MAIYEKNGVFNYLDAQGNQNILYPVTKSDNVDGLDDELALKVNVADIVNNLTSSDTNKPLSAKQGKALQDSKQAKLVSGTNIKTINGTSILGSGDMTTPIPTASASTKGGIKIGSGLSISNEIASVDTSVVQEKLTSGTNIKTINSTSLLGNGNVAVQPTLVSGTNIKTINNTSLLGSGNITISFKSPTLLWSGSSESASFSGTNYSVFAITFNTNGTDTTIIASVGSYTYKGASYGSGYTQSTSRTITLTTTSCAISNGTIKYVVGLL